MIDWSKCKKVLTFFAHPDDETLAAGATMAKLSQEGAQLHVAIPATGIFSRRNTREDAQMHVDLPQLRSDCAKALSILGVLPKHIYLGEFADNEMDRHTLLEVIHWLEALVDRIQPDLVLTHHRYCTNIDHQICHEAAVVATRPSEGQHIPVLCGEVPSSTGYLKPVQWDPQLYVSVTSEQLDAKVRAMQTYRGEARPDPHPRSPEVLKALAKVRGSEAGAFFAEAFMVQKVFG
ncbi:MAG: PIG-L family deacetylase [Deltaproteobacteria bacterium]|nr:PIG-L family deacetylase [Deltaproteobacteria bacterium]